MMSAAQLKPDDALYFAEINTALQLTATEVALLAQNGFVVPERLTFSQFKRGLAWIYWQDLPILVTTDAILHSVHRAYDGMFTAVEEQIIYAKFLALLKHLRRLIRQKKRTLAPPFTALCRDLELYLTLPIFLLEKGQTTFKTPQTIPKWFPQPLLNWIAAIDQVNVGLSYPSMDFTAPTIQSIDLCDFSHEVDFNDFRARGHYDRSPQLSMYFAAMKWFQVLDFRLLTYDSWGKASLQRSQILGAYLLWEAFQASSTIAHWTELESLLNVFVGASDNITLHGLSKFFEAAQIASFEDACQIDEPTLSNILTSQDFGKQQIRGNGQRRQLLFQGELAHDVSFSLFGQRYTPESDILQQLMYDKLRVQGQVVPRPLAFPLDVMASLGNARAVIHLKDELEQYAYAKKLHALQAQLAAYGDDFWQQNLYTSWLKAIMTLSRPTTSTDYPPAMRSDAWADKSLYTQLASWAQLRHDTLLYVKPPAKIEAICDYPTGYVEPYPDFYCALKDYARLGQRFFPASHARKSPLSTKISNYFRDLEHIMGRLEQLAEKELLQQAFDDSDQIFLKNMLVRKAIVQTNNYGAWNEETWDGWYLDLLPFDDVTQLLVSDICTNSNPQFGTVGTLHLGTDYPVPIVFSVAGQSQTTLYVGVVFTVREYLKRHEPQQRLTNRAWETYLWQQSGDYRQNLENQLTHLQTTLQELQASSADDASLMQLQQAIQKTQTTLLYGFDGLPYFPWSASFRAMQQVPLKQLDLPAAFEDFQASLNPILLQLLRPRFEAANGYLALRILLADVQQRPQIVEAIEGMTASYFEELCHVLKQKGYLKDA